MNLKCIHNTDLFHNEYSYIVMRKSVNFILQPSVLCYANFMHLVRLREIIAVQRSINKWSCLLAKQLKRYTQPSGKVHH